MTVNKAYMGFDVQCDIESLIVIIDSTPLLRL